MSLLARVAPRGVPGLRLMGSVVGNKLPEEPSCVGPPRGTPEDVPGPTPPSSPLRVLFFGSDSVAAATLGLLCDSLKSTRALDGSALRLSCSPSGVVNGLVCVDATHVFVHSAGTHASLVTRLEVVCPGDKRYQGKMKPVPTKTLAQSRDIVVHELPPETKSLRRWLPPFPIDGSDPGFDIAVVVSFGYFLPRHVLKPLRFSGINMHPSILPKYRGPSPIPHALLNGDSSTGVSVIELDPSKFDVGAILAQRAVDIEPLSSLESLTATLAQAGAETVMDVLADLGHARANATPQDDMVASTAPFLPRQLNIDWENFTRVRLYNEWRARGSAGGLYTTIAVTSGAHRVNLVAVAPPDDSRRGGPPLEDSAVATITGGDAPRVESEALQTRRFPPGTLHYDKAGDELWVKCADKWAQILEVRVPGRRIASPKDLVNGFRLVNGSHEARLTFAPPPSKK